MEAAFEKVLNGAEELPGLESFPVVDT